MSFFVLSKKLLAKLIKPLAKLTKREGSKLILEMRMTLQQTMRKFTELKDTLSKTVFYQVENKRNGWISVCVQLIKIKIWDRPILSKEIEAVIKNLSTKKRPGPDSFWNFTKPSKKTPIFLRLFHKTETEWISPSSFYEAGIYTQTRQRSTKKN